MRQPGFFSPRQRGFTLIEIAIVIAILGFLLVLLVGISSSLIGQQRRADTRNRLANVETALALFVSQHRRLPCPADGTASGGGAGSELVSLPINTVTTCTLGAGNQQNGVVPWAALGLTEADATDGWGTRLTYRVDPSLVRLNSMNFTYCDPGGTDTSLVLPLASALPIDGTGGYCNKDCTTATFSTACRPPGLSIAFRGLLVKNLAGVSIMNPVGSSSTGAAYVVISHGENRADGYDGNGVLQAAAGTASGTEEAKNAANQTLTGATYFVDDFGVYASGTTHFDDFVLRPTILTVATKAQLGPRAH